MDAKQLQRKLKEMVGKTYQYAKAVHYIKDAYVNTVNESFTIQTNLNEFDRKIESATEFLKYWEPVTGITTTGDNKAVLVEQQDALADEMIKILKDNITKVQTDPKYISQAQTINNNVNSLINVVKLKMSFAKMVTRKP